MQNHVSCFTSFFQHLIFFLCLLYCSAYFKPCCSRKALSIVHFVNLHLFARLARRKKRATEAAAKVDNFTTGVRRLSYRLLCDSLSVLQINVKAKCIPSVILCEMPFFLVTVYQVRQMATLKIRSLELAKGVNSFEPVFVVET